MGRFYGLRPETIFGWLSLGLGILGSVMWMTQFIWDWFGRSEGDKALYSVLTLLLLIMACASTYVANKKLAAGFMDSTPAMSFTKITLISFVIVIVLIMIMNGALMTMSTEYATYTENNYGFLTGLRQLTSVTSTDVNSLTNFALGIRQLVRSLFLIVPGFIATWGGLSVLTADSIDEAEGGILAVVAAMIVFFVVWIFKAMDVALMFM